MMKNFERSSAMLAVARWNSVFRQLAWSKTPFSCTRTCSRKGEEHDNPGTHGDSESCLERASGAWIGARRERARCAVRRIGNANAGLDRERVPCNRSRRRSRSSDASWKRFLEGRPQRGASLAEPEF